MRHATHSLRDSAFVVKAVDYYLKVLVMPHVASFYSVNEAMKPGINRVYHDNSACVPGRGIPEHERRAGTGGYRLCGDCDNLNRHGG
jgi:hypothetical protein